VHLYVEFNLRKSARAHSDCITYIEFCNEQLLLVLSKSANIKVYSQDLELLEIVKMPQMSICS